MLGRQKQVWEAFARVQDWLTRHAPRQGTPIARVLAEYCDVVARVERAAAHQVTGLREGLDATRALRAAVRALRDEHLRPLSVIARAARDVSSGFENACRLPDRRLPVTKLLAEARAIREVAEKQSALFIHFGRGEDFVARLDAAIAEVVSKRRRRDRAKSLHVGATAGLRVHIRRARNLLEILDCHVVSAFADDHAWLAEWRLMRRVQLKPGGEHQRAAAIPDIPPAETAQPSPVGLHIAA